MQLLGDQIIEVKQFRIFFEIVEEFESFKSLRFLAGMHQVVYFNIRGMFGCQVWKGMVYLNKLDNCKLTLRNDKDCKKD